MDPHNENVEPGVLCGEGERDGDTPGGWTDNGATCHFAAMRYNEIILYLIKNVIVSYSARPSLKMVCRLAKVLVFHALPFQDRI